jgi:catalase
MLTSNSSGSKTLRHLQLNTTFIYLLQSLLDSFHVGNPEGIHQLMQLFSDRGTPASLRHINAYSGHTYKFTKEVTTFYKTLLIDCLPSA